RLGATEVYEVGKFDVLRVLAALNVHHAADELFARRAPDLQVNVAGGAEVGGIRRGHVVAVNVEEETRKCKSVQQRAAGGGDMSTTQHSGHGINLRLVGSEPDQRLQIGNRPTFVSNQHRR